MARRKNTKFIDPRYFMDEKTERLDENLDLDKFLDIAADPYADAGTQMKHMGKMSEYYEDIGNRLEQVALLAREDYQYKKYLTTGLDTVRNSPFRSQDAKELKVGRLNFHEWLGKMAIIFKRIGSPGAEQNAEKQLAFTKEPSWKRGSEIGSEDDPTYAGEKSDETRFTLQEAAAGMSPEQFFDYLAAIGKDLPDNRRVGDTGHDMAIRLVGSMEADNFQQYRDKLVKILSVLKSTMSTFGDQSSRTKMLQGIAYQDDSHYTDQGGPPRKL